MIMRFWLARWRSFLGVSFMVAVADNSGQKIKLKILKSEIQNDDEAVTLREKCWCILYKILKRRIYNCNFINAVQPQ